MNSGFGSKQQLGGPLRRRKSEPERGPFPLGTDEGRSGWKRFKVIRSVGPRALRIFISDIYGPPPDPVQTKLRFVLQTKDSRPPLSLPGEGRNPKVSPPNPGPTPEGCVSDVFGARRPLDRFPTRSQNRSHFALVTAFDCKGKECSTPLTQSSLKGFQWGGQSPSRGLDCPTKDDIQEWSTVIQFLITIIIIIGSSCSNGK